MDAIWRPVLLVGGAVPENSYVELTDESLTASFGSFFRRSWPREEIEDAVRRDWPWWMGIGWRTNFRGLFGLIGSYSDCVEIRFRSSWRVWGVLRCDRLAVSLEDPEAFLSALDGAGA